MSRDYRGIQIVVNALAASAWDEDQNEGIWVNEHVLSTHPELSPADKLAIAHEAVELGHVEFKEDGSAFRLTSKGYRWVYGESG
jgi:hypothetical protein